MKCYGCGKEVTGDRRFCSWCNVFLLRPQAGYMAGLFSRWLATIVDLILPVIVIILAVFIHPLVAILVFFAYVIWFFILFSRGTTPGKRAFDIQVIKTDGSFPGFWTMFLREFIGKYISGFFLGLGYFWAIWDKDRQAWHDKIASTVVVTGFKQVGIPKIELEKPIPQAINPTGKEVFHLPEVKASEFIPSKSNVSRCANCGTAIALDSRFCVNCGQPIKAIDEKLICKSCNTELTPDSKFCWECGASV